MIKSLVVFCDYSFLINFTKLDLVTKKLCENTFFVKVGLMKRKKLIY